MARLTAAELAATRTKILAINERAAKKGFPGRLDLTAERVEVTRTDEWTGLKVVEVFYDATLTGDPPKYNGWTLLAVLDWDRNAGLVVNAVPGAPTIDRSNLREGWCEYCATNRDRNLTYLVRNDAGETKQVGSTCIKDFLGWAGRFTYFTESSVTDDLEFWGSGGRYAEEWGTETVLALAWAAIKAEGFKPTSDWSSTRDLVQDVLSPRRGMSDAQRARLNAVRAYIPSSEQAAKDVRAFVLSEDFQGNSDYVDNLKSVLAGDQVSERYLGLAVSAPQAWAREQERTLVRQTQQQAGLNSQWVGTEKQRLRGLVLTVKGLRYLSSDWGTTTLITFADADGNVLKWFRTGTTEWDLETVVTLDATVKKLDTWQDIKQTVLTRGTVKNVEQPKQEEAS